MQLERYWQPCVVGTLKLYKLVKKLNFMHSQAVGMQKVRAHIGKHKSP